MLFALVYTHNEDAVHCGLKFSWFIQCNLTIKLTH